MFNKTIKKIGVIGGMGPAASAHFYKLLVELAQKKYSAVQDTDYPSTFICSVPLEGFDETGIIDHKLVLNQLNSAMTILNYAESDFIVMTCNTIHYFIESLREKSKISVLSIIEEAAKKIKSDNVNCIILLACESTYSLKLYEKVFNKYEIEIITPKNEDRKKITSLIFEVMQGKVSGHTKQQVLELIGTLSEEKPEAVLLGCTELPLAICQDDTQLKLYDTLQILAEASLSYAYSNQK